MIEFAPGRGLRRVLAVGAHADDIEIGAGGTILHMLNENDGIDVCWVVLAAHGDRREEATNSAERFLKGAARIDLRIEGFRERYFPYQAELKEYFDWLGGEFAPDLVLCPWVGDAHQDHRITAQLTLNTFRDHPVLQYEVLKVDGDLGRPNLYVALPPGVAEDKVALLMDMFPSQRRRQWFDPHAFKGLMRLRGVEARAGSGFAEAFHCSQLVVRL